MITEDESLKEMWIIGFLRTISTMKFRLKFNWPPWIKKWNIFVPNFRNTRLAHWKERTHDNLTLIRGADKMLQDFATIAALMDTPPVRVEKNRVEEIKRVQNRMTAEKSMTFRNNFNKHREPSHGSGQLSYNTTGSRNQIGGDINVAQQSTYEGATQFYPRNNWVIPLKRNRSILVVGVQLIDVRISLLTEVTTITAGTVLLEPRRDKPGKILEPIRVLFLVQDGFATKSTVSVFTV